MFSHRVVLAMMALLTGASAIACHHHPRAGNSSAAVAADSLIGIVSVTGTSFEQHIVLRTGDRTVALAATPADSAALSAVGGTEVVLHGLATASNFRVSSFRVRSVNGAPVADGLLRKDGTHFALQTSSESLTLGNPPDALAALIGARIWISGPLATGPNSYGVIVPPR